MHELLIGCPVRKREWVLPSWFTHVECAAAELHIEPTYVFVVDADDDSTMEVILDRTVNFGRSVSIIPVIEPEREDVRVWNEERYEHMAMLRNLLLQEVRKIGPDWFWSVDSDMLVHYESLAWAMRGLDRFDAVGSKAFLTEDQDTRCPNWAMYTASGGLHRQNVEEGCFPVGVLMAIKLMTPKAYNVDYEGHFQGEDIGWSLKAAAAGVRMGWDAHTISKHIMSPRMLKKVDPRVGW